MGHAKISPRNCELGVHRPRPGEPCAGQAPGTPVSRTEPDPVLGADLPGACEASRSSRVAAGRRGGWSTSAAPRKTRQPSCQPGPRADGGWGRCPPRSLRGGATSVAGRTSRGWGSRRGEEGIKRRLARRCGVRVCVGRAPGAGAGLRRGPAWATARSRRGGVWGSACAKPLCRLRPAAADRGGAVRSS
eukprot:scaffold395_cov383-Prasinococcus_capsulatus_cf.AAC.17